MDQGAQCADGHQHQAQIQPGQGFVKGGVDLIGFIILLDGGLDQQQGVFRQIVLHLQHIFYFPAIGWVGRIGVQERVPGAAVVLVSLAQLSGPGEAVLAQIFVFKGQGLHGLEGGVPGQFVGLAVGGGVFQEAGVQGVVFRFQGILHGVVGHVPLLGPFEGVEGGLADEDHGAQDQGHDSHHGGEPAADLPPQGRGGPDGMFFLHDAALLPPRPIIYYYNRTRFLSNRQLHMSTSQATKSMIY